MSKSINAQSLVPVKQPIAQRKIAFLANGSSLNNVKWVCNAFETRPGAIDKLSQWKGSHCVDSKQTAFHSKCDWACGVSGFISELSIKRQWHLSAFFLKCILAHIQHVCLRVCESVDRASYVCLSCYLCARFYSLNLNLFLCRLEVCTLTLITASQPLVQMGIGFCLYERNIWQQNSAYYVEWQ